MTESICNFKLHSPKLNKIETVFVYEVNLVFDRDIFEEKKAWMLDHIHEMVTSNQFIGAHIYEQVNVNPIDDSYLRKYFMTVHYYLDSKESLDEYLIRKAKNMRNQVMEVFHDKYSTWRRVFQLQQVI